MRMWKRNGLSCLLAAYAAVNLSAQTPPPEPVGGQIRISVDPEGAEVSCNGAVVDAPPVTVTGLLEGDHLIVVSKRGFDEVRRTLRLAANQRVNLDVKLQPVLGLLLVHSRPEGATVEVNGAFHGVTPALVTSLPLGNYRVRLTHPGYLPREVDVAMDNRTPFKLEADLVSEMATLSMTSTPPGARVVVNGAARGETPCTVERVPEGDVTVEVLLDGYQPHKQSVRVTAGEEQRVEAILAPIPANLTIVSMPAGARIYVENQFRGMSPVQMNDLKPGSYRLRAELSGFEPMARTVEIGIAQDRVEEFRLQGNTGTMELVTEPAGVTVYVDGKELGLTIAKPGQTDRVSEPFQVPSLTEGRHEVQLTLKGYFNERIQISAERGKTVTLHKKLHKRFIPDCEVVTTTSIYRGVLLEVSPAGDVKLEVSPGVIRSFAGGDIRVRRPIRQDEPSP